MSNTTNTNGLPTTALSPAKLGKYLGVSEDKVKGWIESGELDAVDVRNTGTTNPQRRILPHEIARFIRERAISNGKAKPKARQPQAVEEDFFT